MATLIPSDPSCWRETPSSKASASQRASAPCYGLAEDVLVVPMVVAPFEFRHLERQIFRAGVVERADDAALQQRPEAIDRADVPANIFAPAMVHALMDALFADAVVTPDSSIATRSTLVETVSATNRVAVKNAADHASNYVAAALDRAHHGNLTG
jgi:hypothetical protein